VKANTCGSEEYAIAAESFACTKINVEFAYSFIKFELVVAVK